MEQILVWLANPLTKAILLNIGGWLLPRFGVIKKAVPLALLIISAVTELLGSLWPSLVPPAGAAIVAAAEGSLPWWKAATIWLGNVGLPVVIAVGLHSGSKNVRQWAGLGQGLLRR